MSMSRPEIGNAGVSHRHHLGLQRSGSRAVRGTTRRLGTFASILAVVGLLAIAGPGSHGHAAAIKAWSAPPGPTPGTGDWFNKDNWQPVGVPQAGDIVYINGDNNTVAQIANGNAAADQVYVGSLAGATGEINQTGGTLTLNLLTLGGAVNNTNGVYNLDGTGTLTADTEIVVAHSKFGSLALRSDVAGDHSFQTRDLTVGQESGSSGNVSIFKGAGRVTGNMYVGYNSGAKGTVYAAGDSSSLQLDQDGFIGYLGGSEGSMELVLNAVLRVGGTLHVSATDVGAPAPKGSLSLSTGAAVYGLNPDALLVALGSKARITGSGTYNLKVRFESDPAFGPGSDQTVAVNFARGVLNRASIFTVTAGLTTANVAKAGSPPATTAEKLNTLTAQMLPGAVNAKWGDAGFNQDVGFNTPRPTDPERPTVELPYDPNQVSGTVAVPKANVDPRVRVWQFAQTLTTSNGSLNTPVGQNPGEIRNITASLDAKNKLAVGQTQFPGGNFDLVAGGKAVTPVHQNPDIAALQNPATYNLNGAGVVIGQIELGQPYAAHGCFDDWSQADTTRLRLSYSGGAPGPNEASAHATTVASIMIGYDPLGIQVDGQSRFEDAANRYNDGFGFVGVAPAARLISRKWGDAAKFDDFAALAQEQIGGTSVKIINMSAGYSNYKDYPATGDQIEEVVADYWVKKNGIIFTQSAGNSGSDPRTLNAPAGAYNGIVVGNMQFDGDKSSYPRDFSLAKAKINPSSSIGPTAGPKPRSKPDLVAQGTGNLTAFTMTEVNADGQFITDKAYTEQGNRGLYSTRRRDRWSVDEANSGTSFAAPTVAGVAALVLQQADRMKSNDGKSPLVVKSILQTSAHKPADWKKGSGAAGDQKTSIPLSYTYGAGVLNPIGAVDLLKAGEHTFGLANPIDTPGWNLSLLSGKDTDNDFKLSGQSYLLDGVAADTPLTITLNWYRDVTFSGGNYTANPLTNLDLQLYTWDGATATPLGDIGLSNSTVDNLEHIYIPKTPAAGDYLLRVYGVGMAADVTEQYGVSWLYTPVPEPSTLSAALLIVLLWGTRRPCIAARFS
jgi:hypothetical protein